MKLRLRPLLRARTQSGARPVVRGSMRTAVVVRMTDTLFSEAVYILRDEPLREKGVSRDALLNQAVSAAEEKARAVLPPGQAPLIHPAAAFLLGAALALLAVWAFGLV